MDMYKERGNNLGEDLAQNVVMEGVVKDVGLAEKNKEKYLTIERGKEGRREIRMQNFKVKF